MCFVILFLTASFRFNQVMPRSSFKTWPLNACFVSPSPAETLPHEENGLIKEQRYMDSASNSMTPRPQTMRSSSEYHSQAGSLYHPGNGTALRRLSSNPAELSSTQPLRRVEGTVRIRGTSFIGIDISNLTAPRVLCLTSSQLDHRSRLSCVGAGRSAAR